MDTQRISELAFRATPSSPAVECETPEDRAPNGDKTAGIILRKPLRSEADRLAASEAHARLQAAMLAAGITEEDIVEDFENFRKERRGKVS